MEVWRDFEVPAWLIPKDDVDVEGLEVESHLLAGVDGDTSDLLETSVVDVKDASVNPATSS
jgi:hypothetical protein